MQSPNFPEAIVLIAPERWSTQPYATFSRFAEALAQRLPTLYVEPLPRGARQPHGRQANGRFRLRQLPAARRFWRLSWQRRHRGSSPNGKQPGPAMLAEALEATLRRLGWDRFWLLVAGEFAAAGQLARSRRLRGLIYLDLERAGRPLLRTPEAIDVAERADLRVSSAYPAAQHFEATLGPSRWLPLGTPGFFLARLKARPPQEPGEPPVTRPYYVLYPGTIDATVDLELLAAVAQRTPEITYLLAGKIARPLAELAPLKALDNVRVLGPLAEADWHRWLLETDTGFLPLQPAAGGAVQLPAGLMLLLGKGKPVVSSMWVELPGMERARYFRKANAPASLARLLRQAIAHDTQSEQIRRIRFARERDWHEQARKFLAWLPAGR